MSFIVALHVLCVILLSTYALNQGVLLILFFRAKRRKSAKAHSSSQTHVGPKLQSGSVPIVTIQIPLFNERFVAERAISAAVAQDYPRDCLQIQVLDDSTDDTTHIAQGAVEAAREAGVCIELVHRTDRAGFKAGAMEAGLASARGELIAIFDADFLPPPNFLRRVICEHDGFADPDVGFVQTCWGYLNREASVLTRAQAMTLDVHFVIEQPARNGNGLLMNFNGSGGIWRRACIEDAGGWQADTLTEDLDLSYRAQLRGWSGLYLANEFSPSELPRDVLAYKRQQARWARGTLQTIRKLMPRIAQSSLPMHRKVAAWMHMTGYFIHPLILVMTITTPLLLLHSLLPPARSALPGWVNLISVLSFAPIASMCVAHSARHRPLIHFLRDLPAALMLGIGTCFSNTLSMLKALFEQHIGDWTPTPKSRSSDDSDGPDDSGGAESPAPNLLSQLTQSPSPQKKAYSLQPDWTMWIELGLAIYVAGAMIVMLQRGYLLSVVPMVLYVLGFGGVWLNQLLGALRRMEG
jgi:cellulose synthase/poly-beta-1,6-N-acetylglucosamine synthase-like glycosyltransferase